MENKTACKACFQNIAKKYEIDIIAGSRCCCEDDDYESSAMYGYYEAPKTVLKCQFCLPPRGGPCPVHDVHRFKILKEKVISTSLSTN